MRPLHGHGYIGGLALFDYAVMKMNPRNSLAFVALGSNIGNSLDILSQAMDTLEDLSAQNLLRSSIWKTEPVDCPPGSPPFLNAIAALLPLPGETPESLLAKLQEMERLFGRRPKVVLNEPRPLDLDLIAFGQERRSSKEVSLPHPRAHLRRFVLAPLAEVAPDYVLPGQTITVRELLKKLPETEEAENISGPLPVKNPRKRE